MLKLFKLPDKLVKYSIALLLLAIPLYPKFPFARISGTYVSIRLEDFLLLLVAIILLVKYFPRFVSVFKGGVERSVILYLGVGLVSLISGIFLTQTVQPHIGLLHWIRRIEYFIPFFLGLMYFKDNKPKSLDFFIKVLIVGVTMIFLYGLGQKYLSWPVIITQNSEYSKGVALRWIPGSHINSTFAGHYDLSSYLVLILPLFVALFFLLEGLWAKITLSGVIFFGLWLLANAVSRISVVSYLLASSLSLFLLKKYKEIPLVLIASLLIFSFSSNLIARYTQIIEVMYQKTKQNLKINYDLHGLNVYAQDNVEVPKRRETSKSVSKPLSIFEDRSTSIRLNVEWPRAIRAFSKNPILGTGYSSITLATDNDFLRLLGEVGIIGFSVFILIFFNIAKLAVGVLKNISKTSGIEKGFLISYIAALPAVMLNAFFIDIFEASKFAIIFWLITGIFVSLARNTIYEENS